MLSIILFIACFCLGGFLGYSVGGGQGALLIGAAVGLGVGLAAVALLRVWSRLEAAQIVGGALGMLLGAILGTLIDSGVNQVIQQAEASLAVYGLIMVPTCLVGMQLGAYAARGLWNRSEAPAEFQPTIGILDTSVIIDGRIADVCETGFLDGDLIIPQFVLHELQAIADSSESTKRTRGRRGLDILQKIQKQSYVNVIIDDTDYPSIKEVDQKLINMAKELGCAILTNDFNLNKVAEVHSIQVLNINQLANALKPIVLPGETMKVQVIKEGKEHSQGVAYLDDGTMVVVDNGRRYIGKTMEVTVTSVLQTTAGRMIFAMVKG
jgi:uncharacterized protein YacL